MKKLLLISAGLMILGACAFHSKQPVNENYYKKTQSVAWPDTAPAQTASKTSAKNGASYGASQGAGANLNWQDPAAPDRKVAIPDMPEKKLQCVKTGRDAYTCRIGQYQCGTGCQADGSNCRYGYCLTSDCNDVMGQQWDLVYKRSPGYHVCQHPSEKVFCYPDGTSGGNVDIKCYDTTGSWCGSECNKNGTQCARGPDTCWSKYRNVQ